MTNILAAVSHDGGRSFTPPARVNGARGAYVGNQETPSIAAGIAGQVVVSWLEVAGGRMSLLVARSLDGSRTFQTPIAVASGESEAGAPMVQRMIGDLRGGIYVAWSQGGDLYLAISRDGGGSFAAPRRIVPTICECCTPALAIEDGVLHVAFRNREHQDRIRDIYVIRSHDAGETFGPKTRVSDSSWGSTPARRPDRPLAFAATGSILPGWTRERRDRRSGSRRPTPARRGSAGTCP